MARPTRYRAPRNFAEKEELLSGTSAVAWTDSRDTPSGTRAVALVAADDEALLTSRQVCARLGGISTMTLWRWLANDRVRFPRPTVRINQRRYWSAGAIRRWLAERQGADRNLTMPGPDTKAVMVSPLPDTS